MATLRVVPAVSRINDRLTYGDLQSVLLSANRDHKEGRINCAVAGYEEVLGQWLRLKWIEVSGKYRTEIDDPLRFLNKLRSGCHLDNWTQTVINVVLRRPDDLSYRSADVIRAVVTALVLDRVSEVVAEGGEVCQLG